MKIISVITGMIVAAVLLSAAIFPLIDDMTVDKTEISNSGASWIRMDYISDQSDYSVEYSFDENGINVGNQSGEYEDMILYADSENILCIVNNKIVQITGDGYEIYADDVETFTVERTGGVVSFNGVATETPVEWAYVPMNDGVYGSFGSETLPLKYITPTVAVGGFAGIYGYNDRLTKDVGLVMDADITDKVINSVRWAVEEHEPLETDTILPIRPGDTILPFNPIGGDETDEPSNPGDTLDPEVIDPDIGGNVIMAVPTPTYTDGVWGFDLDANNRATIVSYSGTGGDITVPITVSNGGNTYNVYRFGKGGSGNIVFDDTNISDFTLTFPTGWNGIRLINSYACYGCTHLTELNVQSADISSIPVSAFRGCTGLQSVSWSSTAMAIGDSAFYGCTSLSTVPFDKIVSIQSASFRNCSNITGTLDLSTVRMLGDSFYGCTGITKVIIGPNLTSWSGSVNSGTFRGCTGLTSAEILCNQIGGGAFENCTNLATISMPNVIAIGVGAFRNTGLTEVVIPTTVTTIGSDAFRGSTALVSVTIQTNPTTFGTYVFQDCTNLVNVSIPSTIVNIPNGTFYGTGIKEVPNENNLVTIGNYAFRDSALEGVVVIAPTVSTIGVSAFAGCEGVTSLIVCSDVIPAAGNQYNPEAFADTEISEVLNLSNTEWTITSYGLNAEEVRSDIDAELYIAVVDITIIDVKEGMVYKVINLFPLMLVLGLLCTAGYLFFRR